MATDDLTFIVVVLVVAAVIMIFSVLMAPTWSRHAEWYVREWANERGYRLVSIKRLWWSRGDFQSWLDDLPSWWRRNKSRYYEITTVDDRSVERVGTARVYDRNVDAERTDVRWRSERQLAPGRPGEWVRGDDEPVTEGWGADPSGRHEQRWFSAGTPTPLVRDGRVEGRDPLDDRHGSGA
jgi:hypothetical protein